MPTDQILPVGEGEVEKHLQHVPNADGRARSNDCGFNQTKLLKVTTCFRIDN